LASLYIMAKREVSHEEFASLLSLISSMKQAGYIATEHVSETLQGCIVRAVQIVSNKKVAVKVTNILLHQNRLGKPKYENGFMMPVNEDIIKEASILRYLTQQPNCPDTIIKFVDLFQSRVNIFFVMSDGGLSLFNFVKRGHRLIEAGKLDISEWHRVTKAIFLQMVSSIAYIHQKQVAHYDISLENYLINDIAIQTTSDGKIKFLIDSQHPLHVRLCDFGLSEHLGPLRRSGYHSNKFCGKLSYKSPECVSGKQYFDPLKNDIWCLGISLFMMVLGVNPWVRAVSTDPNFVRIMNGGMVDLLREANKQTYVNSEIVFLLNAFFKYEKKRIDVAKLTQFKWFKQ